MFRYSLEKRAEYANKGITVRYVTSCIGERPRLLKIRIDPEMKIFSFASRCLRKSSVRKMIEKIISQNRLIGARIIRSINRGARCILGERSRSTHNPQLHRETSWERCCLPNNSRRSSNIDQSYTKRHLAAAAKLRAYSRSQIT